jgi:hypothetical protein
MNFETIKSLIDENIPDDLDKYTPEDIDKNLLFSIQFVLDEIRLQVDRAVSQKQRQFLMS